MKSEMDFKGQKFDILQLGVTFDSKLLWSRHISDISKKAGQRLGALRKIANKLDTAGRATVYKAQIRSIMEYALSVMDECLTNSLKPT